MENRAAVLDQALQASHFFFHEEVSIKQEILANSGEITFFTEK